MGRGRSAAGSKSNRGRDSRPSTGPTLVVPEGLTLKEREAWIARRNKAIIGAQNDKSKPRNAEEDLVRSSTLGGWVHPPPDPNSGGNAFKFLNFTKGDERVVVVLSRPSMRVREAELRKGGAVVDSIAVSGKDKRARIKKWMK